MNQLQRKSMLCPNCNRLIHIDEPRCPFCGTSRPGSAWKNNPLIRGLNQADRLIRTIIYLNAAMFILSLLLNTRLPGWSMNPFSVLAPENRSLLFLGATGTIPIDQYGRLWTLLAANYLHSGILHILFNMLALRQLAPVSIREYGPYRFVVIYTLGGVLGFWVSYRAGVSFTLGASAAVCALIGALLYYGLSRGGDYGHAIFRQVGGWTVGLVAFGLLVPGINNWGHGGGLLAGAALAFFMGYQERLPERWPHKLLGGICAAATLLILVWAAVSGIYYRYGA